MNAQETALKQYVLRKDGNVWLLLSLPIWLAGVAAMCGILLYGQVTEPLKYPELWLAPPLLLLVFAFGLRIWLWHVRGKEVITAYATHIAIERHGSFLFPMVVIPINELDGVGTVAPRAAPFWLWFWNSEGSTVRIGYLGRGVLFGGGLSQTTAETIAHELNELYRSAFSEQAALEQT